MLKMGWTRGGCRSAWMLVDAGDPLESPGRWAVRAGGVCSYSHSELRQPHGNTIRDRIDPELIKGIWWEIRPWKPSFLEDRLESGS